VQGDLRLDQVGGDLSVRGVEGLLACRTVGGDLRASHLGSGLEATAGGDGSLTTAFTPGCDYQLKTGGDIIVRFPDKASARFQVNAGGDIRHRVDWVEISQDARALSGLVGEGAASVELAAGGDVSLRGRSDSRAFAVSLVIDDDLDAELESMAEQIERDIEAHMARLDAQLEAKLGRIDHDAIRLKAEKARRKAEQAAERARLKAERAQRRWRRVSPAQPPHPPRPARPSAQPVSNEERMKVLQMVQEGTISAEDAARLLEAMEG
jgi:hypothetical protein